MAGANDSWRFSRNNENDESNESFVLNSDSDAEYEAKNSSSEDEDDLLADNSGDGLGTSGTEHNARNAGRLTPMIRKAIRRSIHQFSRDSSDDEKNMSDDETKKENYIPDSEEESDLEQPILKSKSKKKRVVELDSSESSDEGYKPNIESGEDSSDELEAEVVPDFRDHRIKDETERTQGKHTLINLDSSEEKENISDNSPHSKFAMSIAAEESRNSTLDPLNAQTKALLMYQREQVEQKLAKTKMLLNRGNLHMLPDKGERLHTSRLNDEKELEVIKDKLKQLDTGDQSAGLLKVKKEELKKTLFQKGSLEIDPTYLKPTTANIEKDLGKKAQETLYREQTLTVDRLKDLHGSLLAKPPEDQRAKDPRGLKVPLMPHQQYALTWLLWREQQNPAGGVLADDMGLGKTLTMISLVMTCNALRESGDMSDGEEEWASSARTVRHLGGTLVVAPASLVAQWASEVKKRCRPGLLSVELYHGNNRETNIKRLARNDIVITTYNILSRGFKSTSILYKIRWRRVILDEAHVIRNHKSLTCESVCGLYANKRWVLTGTPVHNKEMDLFSILKFLRCSPFDDVRVWKRWVDNKNAAGHERLATVMKSIMLRRTKQELQANGSLESLPDKMIENIEVQLDPEERLVYDKVMVYSRTLFAQFLAQRAEKAHMYELGAGKYDRPSWTVTHKDTQFTKAQKKLLSMHADVAAHEILVLLLRLRQVCCHPSLINAMLDKEDLEHNGLAADDAGDLIKRVADLSMKDEDNEEDGEIGVDERVAEHLLTSDNPVFDANRRSSKMRVVLEKVVEITAKGDKLIVVSQWVSVLEILAREFDSVKEISYEMFTGKVAVKDRQGIMDDFNSRNSKTNVLLLSLTAGGVGLNLVGANHLLLIDIHWNPQLECQAQDRIYRFGQKKNVFIYKYICTDTIEERIKALQEKKMAMANDLLSGGGKVGSSKLSLDEMKTLFGL